jgi:hypothetical protein
MKTTKWIKGTRAQINDETKIEYICPMILMKRVPMIPAIVGVEARKPLIWGSEISPMYIGKTVYRAPSVAPITKRIAEIMNIDREKAMPMKPRKTIGVIKRVEFLRPIKSPRIAARRAPKGEPSNGIIAHQEPSSLVVGTVEVSLSNCGKYGDVHPKLIPELMIENTPREKCLMLIRLKKRKTE